MALLFKSNSDSAARWEKELRTHIPDLDFRVWPDYGDPADIDFALVWGMPAGEFHKFPNLRCIASLGAGVDHIFRDPDLPEGVAITRLVDPWMAQAMSEYVLLQVLRFHRQGTSMPASRRRRNGTRCPSRTPPSAASAFSASARWARMRRRRSPRWISPPPAGAARRNRSRAWNAIAARTGWNRS
jgi:phosphoglycerate dehydrogenase-like enzyme